MVSPWRAARGWVFACLVLLAVVPAGWHSAGAQGPGGTGSQAGIAQDASGQIESIARAAALVERLSNAETVDDQTLASARVKLDGLARDLQAVNAAVEQRLADINARIDQIAPASEGAADPPSVAEERQVLADEKAALAVVSGRIADADKAIAATVERIAERRRAAFTEALFKRTQIDRSLLQETWSASRSEAASLYVLVSNWLTFVVRTKPLQFALSTIGAFILAFAMFLAIRRMFASLLFRNPAVTQPSYFSKIVIAFWSAILPSLVFAVFLAVTFWLYDYFEILSPSIHRIAAALFPALAGIFFVYNLARAILAPRDPRWRLVGVHSAAAGKLLFLTTAMACIYGADAFLGSLNEIVSAPLPLTVSKSLFAALLFGAVIIVIALTRAGISDEDGTAVGWPRWISAPLLLIGVFIIVTAMAGYIGLARFAAQQIVVTGAILITMYIGILAGRQIGSEGLLAQSRFGRVLQDRLSLQPHTIEQLGIVAGILFIVLVLLLGTPLILLQWGSQPEDIALWFGRAFSGFQIGAVRISFSGLLLGLLIFAIGVVITKLIQKWLGTSVLPRSNIDSGVRDSIKTGVGYFGFALAALFAVTSAGIDLSSLAIVAGALSIGIGFGLQNIVSNFVSGLILLVERPIKVGDWVETGGTAGFVKKISVRATEIETFQRQTMIVPNSELINSVVGNWTHKYRGGRIDIAVGVAYGSDIRKVREILLEIARENTMILKHPEPFVVFTNFGDSSLDFELRFHLSDILKLPIVSTDVRFAIVEAFEEHGIEIPFPQRDLHVRSGSLGVTADGQANTAADSPPGK
ncbi:MAG TPA: mechanosensitive ion channel domain-containing protein [Afifellaceae bacterium]|nr:mechanosensitive ion channel domain-containing protein [Afifellaceae bacterium]